MSLTHTVVHHVTPSEHIPHDHPEHSVSALAKKHAAEYAEHGHKHHEHSVMHHAYGHKPASE